MLSDKAKQWIKKRINGIYSGNADSAIRVFEFITEISTDREEFAGVNERLPSIIEEMSNEGDLTRLENDLAVFSKIEGFAHYVLFLVDPEKERSKKWTLAPILTDGLDIVPGSYNIDSGKPEHITFRYKDRYTSVYSYRNKDSHYFTALDQFDVFKAISEIMVVYLDIASRYSHVITSIFRKAEVKKTFDLNAYINSINEEHRNKVKEGFGFVDLIWSDGSKELKVRDVLKNSNTLMVTGEAGCGKTTLMQEMAYLTATEFSPDKDTYVPVYFELKKLSNTSFSIEGMLAGRIGITGEEFTKLTNGFKLAVFLDGFNEILNTDIKSKFAVYLESYIRKNTKHKYFVSDRSVVRSEIILLKDSRKIHLSPLTVRQKEEFLKRNTKDQTALKTLVDTIHTDPGYFATIRTPLQLMHLIEVTSYKGKLPDDYVGDYLESVIEREMNDKKDINAHYLRDFLDLVGVAMLNTKENRLSEVELKMLLRKARDELGYEKCDTDTVMRLMIDMGLLAKEQDDIVFLNSDYLNFFWVEGGMRGFEKLL